MEQNSLMERSDLPDDLVAQGINERSLDNLEGIIPNVEKHAVFFENGDLFLSDTFRGNTQAAFVLARVKANSTNVSVRVVPSSVLIQYQRSKNNNSSVGINYTDDKEVLREVGEFTRNAASRGASDIHIVPERDSYKLRIRVNRDIVDIDEYPTRFALQMLQAGHVASEETSKEPSYLLHKFQSARLRPEAIGGVPGYESIRCQWNPETKGRSLFMRLQRPIEYLGSFENMGYKPFALEALNRAVSLGKGGVLLAAPTNAGKTTTLAMMCHTRLKRFNQNGISIEDPPEFELDMRQLAINAGDDPDAYGLAVNKALKAINRSDPSFVMIGEMRGAEFADAVVKIAAAHYLMSSFHADNAMEALPQFERLGVDSYDVYNPTIFKYLMCQRLLQVLCSKCSKPINLNDIDSNYNLHRLASAGVDLKKVRSRGQGCVACSGTGVSGMVPILEPIKTTAYYMDAIQARDTASAHKHLLEQEIPSMADEAINYLLDGKCDPDNVINELGDITEEDLRFGDYNG